MSRRADARGRALSGRDAPELWCVDLSSTGEALHEMERRTPRLSSVEMQNAPADPSAAKERLATHIALRLLLERVAGTQWRGVAFARGNFGKPQLAGSRIGFSLSHADGLALIGLDPRGCIGVDLERARVVRVREPRRGRVEAAGAALDPEQPLPDGEDARFLQAWVRLEAFAKADGCGIGRLLTRLGITRSGAATLEGVAQRIEEMRAKTLETRTRDLDLGAGLYAAVALSPDRAVPAICWLPASIDGLERLAG